MNNHALIQLPQFVDECGILVAVHGEIDIPFAIQRVYYIYNVDLDARRAIHAHKKSKKILICLKGQCSVDIDDGRRRQTYLLNDPVYGLFIDQRIWLEYQCSADCTLLVLDSTRYDPDDYIYDYQEFLKYCND